VTRLTGRLPPGQGRLGVVGPDPRDTRIVSGLVWVLSGYIALPHKFMGVCRDWGDVICLASCGDYLAPTQRGMFYTEL